MNIKQSNKKQNPYFIFLILLVAGVGMLIVVYTIIGNDVSVDNSKASSQNESTYQNGGTDIVLYDLGDYATNKADELIWRSDSLQGGIKTIIGSYDLNPKAVEKLVSDACKDNQKKIGLIVWYSPFTDQMEQSAAYGWLINSKGGKLNPRQEQNLNHILELIKNQKNTSGKSCFNQIQFRFSPMSTATPTGWEKWEEEVYKEDYSFIVYTKNLIDKKLLGSKIQVIYDLGAELGGFSTKQSDVYIERLWRDYTTNFGTKDTYGFSIAYDPGRIKSTFSMYDKIGKRPDRIALDLYPETEDEWDSTFKKISAEIQSINAESLPVLVQETFSTDTKSKIFDYATSNNIILQSVMQWQAVRKGWRQPNGSFSHFSGTFYKYNYDFEIVRSTPTPTPTQTQTQTLTPTKHTNKCESYTECSQHCKVGDINCDSNVNIKDLSSFCKSLKENPNTSDSNLSREEYLSDMNNDGTINIKDFSIFRDQYVAENTK